MGMAVDRYDIFLQAFNLISHLFAVLTVRYQVEIL